MSDREVMVSLVQVGDFERQLLRDGSESLRGLAMLSKCLGLDYEKLMQQAEMLRVLGDEHGIRTTILKVPE